MTIYGRLLGALVDRRYSEGGMMRLETLIELKFVNSSCSSLSSCGD